MLSVLPSAETALVAAAQSLPFGVAITDPHGTVTWANAAYAQLTGCTPDELLGQSAGEFDWDALSHAAPSSEHWRGQAVCRRKTGEAYSVEHSITTLRDPAGEVAGFWVMKRDATDLKWPAGTFSQAEANQSTHDDATYILDTMQEAYLRLDGELRFTFINRAAEFLLGATDADLIGKTPWEVRPETAGSPLEQGFRRAKAENAIVSFENYYEPWKRWYNITAVPDSYGGFVVHFSDITERKTADVKLQAQNDRFRRIIENTDAGYFRIGMDGCYEDVNAAWLRMHGFALKEKAIGLDRKSVV